MDTTGHPIGQQYMRIRNGEVFDEQRFRKRVDLSKQRLNGFLVKPDHPLPWTSSVTPRQGMSWIEWSDNEMPGSWAKDTVVFNVDPSAKVFEILDVTDMPLDGHRYHRPSPIADDVPWRHRKMYLDFDALAQDGYHGVHIDIHGDLYWHFYGWDAESTVWFDTSPLTVDKVVHTDAIRNFIRKIRQGT